MPRFKSIVFLLFLLLTFKNISATQVKIGVLYGSMLNEINVSYKNGNSALYCDSVLLKQDSSDFNLKIVAQNDSIFAYKGDSIFVCGKSFQIKAIEYCVNVLNHPKFKQEKVYSGSLIFNNVNGFLFIVNDIEIEDYLPGVLEAEVGLKRPPEYYKVQAIICRTYTLSHLRRHEMEDINLCDREHCQVYKGVSNKNQELNKAVSKTADVVMVDNDFLLITAAFHANCGGQTVNSEDVWNNRLSYLRSIKDTFCLREKSAVWSKQISLEKWKECMLKLCPNYDYGSDSLISGKDNNFLQFTRKKDYSTGTCTIPLKEIRTALGLRSTFFNAFYKDGIITLSGRGFGHGAGLCQDGAIRMAKLGYSYKTILHYYYQNTSIINLDKLDFFMYVE